MNEPAIINFDGGAVPNPGKAAAAAIIQWQGQTRSLQPLCTQARSLLSQFQKYELLWIPRSENTLADSLVGQCINNS